MKTAQRAQDTKKALDETENNLSNNNKTEAPITDAGSVSGSNNDGKKVSHQDIEFVQNLIERCLQLYMNRDEVVKTLLNRARIDPGFTSLVWQKLEEENADFFRAYYIRLKLKKQILLFNHLLEHQYRLMNYSMPPKVPLAPMQNGIHPMSVNNLPMGYPVLQQPPMSMPGQPHLDTMGSGISSCHVVNGVPAPSNFHPIRMNSGNDFGLEIKQEELHPVIRNCINFHGTIDLWLRHLGPLGNYPGSPFLPSDSEILLDSPEQEDIVEEFFVDSVPEPPDEEKS
uniref:Angiotensin-converting enzyme 2 n=1 Tax=Cucumis sativus TaxID=3659 RepID=A0A0A0L766_CUCSA